MTFGVYSAGPAMEQLRTWEKERPQRLSLNSLMKRPELFQPRAFGARDGLDEYHVTNLRKALRAKGRGGDLDPVLVLATKSGAVVLDGHHRVIAYEREGRPDVPVEWFDGSLKDAIAVAGQANSKTKLALTCRQRRDGSASGEAACIALPPTKASRPPHVFCKK
ncbi:ParB/RepB/Spo0J family partition protein [Rhodomicrobium sp.]|uniref:ParB/RepB/Spo0J family partition protein n=1 Tax=Rhodomicrobium sp. TaxID=2720632 RepID=UPI0039E21B9E